MGDIKTARIVIEDGAYFKGNIDIVRAEAPRPAAVPTPKPQAIGRCAGGPRTQSSRPAPARPNDNA